MKLREGTFVIRKITLMGTKRQGYAYIVIKISYFHFRNIEDDTLVKLLFIAWIVLFDSKLEILTRDT